MTSISSAELGAGGKSFRSHLLTRPPKIALILTVISLAIAVLTVLALIYVPWRQTVVGQGQVEIFDPLERPQTIDSQIKGRLRDLLVKEGDNVAEGQVIAHVEDRDSKFLDPSQQERIGGQMAALREKKAAAFRRVAALGQQQNAIAAFREAKLATAGQKVVQAEQKVVVSRQMLVVAKQDLITAQLQEERIAKLEEAGLKSRRDLELTVQKRVEAQAKLAKLEGELLLLEQDIRLYQLELSQIPAEAAEKIQKVEEGVAKAQEMVAEIDEKLEKLQNEYDTLKVRKTLRTITAPRAGRIVNLKKLGLGQLIKEGETIARVVPEVRTRGVELYLNGLDAPLVEVGVPVRLMFEGFPAVPFAGWDWASVGTFGGVVTAVDPVDSVEEGKNGFRVWVLPDHGQTEWPSQDRLRIGSKAVGWLQLNEVPLYYELWRQLNAFPAKPSVNGENGKKEEKLKTKPVIRR